MADRGLFEPDALIRHQFGDARKGAAVSSEKRLMLAVLENALDHYKKYIFAEDAQGRQLFCEAAEWIHSPHGDGFYSFQNVCETLEINPEYLRRGLERWEAKMAKQHGIVLKPVSERATATSTVKAGGLQAAS